LQLITAAAANAPVFSLASWKEQTIETINNGISQIVSNARIYRIYINNNNDKNKNIFLLQVYSMVFVWHFLLYWIQLG
jgi:hypothetical protein